VRLGPILMSLDKFLSLLVLDLHYQYLEPEKCLLLRTVMCSAGPLASIHQYYYYYNLKFSRQAKCPWRGEDEIELTPAWKIPVLT
jgi:hypothetical protein